MKTESGVAGCPCAPGRPDCGREVDLGPASELGLGVVTGTHTPGVTPETQPPGAGRGGEVTSKMRPEGQGPEDVPKRRKSVGNI